MSVYDILLQILSVEENQNQELKTFNNQFQIKVRQETLELKILIIVFSLFAFLNILTFFSSLFIYLKCRKERLDAQSVAEESFETHAAEDALLA